MKLYVEHFQECVSRHRGEGEYADWAEEFNFEIVDVALQKSPQSWSIDEFETDFDVRSGDAICVLYITKREGDSFGESSGQGEALWVFKDSVAAYAAAEQWRNNDKKEFVVFKSDSGKEVKMSNPANDYFTRLIGVNIAHKLVKPQLN